MTRIKSRPNLKSAILVGLAFIAMTFSVADHAGEKFVVPPLTGAVIDRGGFLGAKAQAQLDGYLHALNSHGKVQLQVVTLDTLEDEPIEQASIKIVEKWKLGRAKVDNGVLLLISRQERKMRIEVGQGLEGDLPDVYCKRIIEDDMSPFFRQGQAAKGIFVGVMKIVSYVDPEFLDSQSNDYVQAYSANQKHSWAHYLFIIVFLLFMVGPTFTSLFALGSSRRYFGGGGWGGGFGGGGDGGFSGGSGGSWGGGGGGFSGGGASGGW